ncbi:hypothetical protein M409DRAFT_27718 [Zasmidium cellare ATCC 36951]|uniref:Rad4 beta-hairpin domain-containing protein n=1 Tax=Zasmidium cellare ATCC 36951 TaxID=1080233 RepID=A0A6A6C4Z1_ZASCE|nr:uncharacterized protein M409DRAFT_27718 [Zasmidium cellare ATCC 36951]KAF2161993.1 hypothetical protein M409DRAFT_27718 [Zasmidium cellare ATCC 36951]
MPPFVPRKREHSPEPLPQAKRQKKPASKDKKPTLFEAADTPSGKLKSSREAQEYLDGRDDDDDELSDVDSDEFEDAQPSKKQKTAHAPAEDDDDEMDWEDAIGEGSSAAAKTPAADQDDGEIGDISVSLNDDGTYVEPLVSLATGKKGPSKRERQIRVLTHCLHVQTLLWHNTVRNSWLNDKEVHSILLDGLTEGVKSEITRWREAMGTLSKEELEAKKKEAAAKNRGKQGRKGKEKSSGRDWNYDAQHTEQGVPNLSGGDPLLRLLKMLTAYWRKRFTVTGPALRKQGYMPLKRLRDDIKAWEKNRSDAEEHGERVNNKKAFRELARRCEGSRDVGGQLFVALLRAVGLETRMVVNLQPAGLGWSKAEEANPKKSKKEQNAEAAAEEPETNGKSAKHPSSAKSAEKALPKLKEAKPKRKSARGNQGRPINLDDSGSSLSEPPSSDSSPEEMEDDDDDLSVIDVTPSTRKKPTTKYDRDLAFPTYWAEVCSPVSHKFIPVDPIVLSTIASNDELLQTFEPRGKKAENAKQVIAYTIAFNADNTAKDVTIRYLKKHQLPGKTKGMRMPAEKIPIYNKRGKVKKYEDYDWFRTVMSLYDRPELKRTPADDLEEQTDLKPFKAGKEEKEVEKESLQWYKQSAEFVLEQHLRREEAIKPGSKPVKKFSAGKGDKAKEHDVYRRDDVVPCKTVESWHKEGRMIKEGAQPMKHVPMRAVTLIRKREMEDALRETGEKLQQALYSWDQTDWIIPPPIENGVIPKNAFGNMDVYVDTMVPKGAVHLPLKGTAKLCRKLEIDYAEACTGFEFGKQRAVPVLTGVVVAQENAQMVRDAWRAEQAEIKRKEDTKRTDTALHWWRKMLMGLRIIDRMRVEYANSGGAEEEINPFVKKAKYEGREENIPDDNNNAGGFFRPGHDEEEVPQGRPNREVEDDLAGGFMAEDDDEDEDVTHEDAGDGGFLIEEDAESLQPSKPVEAGHHAPVTPISLQSLHHPVGRGEDEFDGGDDENDEPDELRAPSVNAKVEGARSNKNSPKRSKSKAKAKVTSDSDESPLSDPEDEDERVIVSRKRTSPKVIITPQAKAKSSARARPSRSAAKKATPVRSQYFFAADDDEDDEQSSEQEVVKPKRTTARTRNKRA